MKRKRRKLPLRPTLLYDELDELKQYNIKIWTELSFFTPEYIVAFVITRFSDDVVLARFNKWRDTKTFVLAYIKGIQHNKASEVIKDDRALPQS